MGRLNRQPRVGSESESRYPEHLSAMSTKNGYIMTRYWVVWEWKPFWLFLTLVLGVLHFQCGLGRVAAPDFLLETGGLALRAAVPPPAHNPTDRAKIVIAQGRVRIFNRSVTAKDTLIKVQGGLLEAEILGIPVGTYTLALSLENENSTPFWEASAGLQIQANHIADVTLFLARVGDAPPTIQSLEVISATGSTGDPFRFRALLEDLHDRTDSLQVRWDWDSDGVFEVDWTYAKEQEYLFQTQGVYTVQLEARDRTGQVNRITREVTVTAPTVGNTPPTAHAGADMQVQIGTAVTLDGSKSSDPDGDELTFRWTVPAGINLSSAVVAQPEFNAISPGTYVFSLIVNDGQTNSPPAEVRITVVRPPVADAGPDQNVQVGTEVTLDGRASNDPDGDALTFHWTAPAGIALNSNSVAQPQFTPTEEGVYRFILVVNDGQVDSPPDEVVITVVESGPAMGEIIIEVPLPE